MGGSGRTLQVGQLQRQRQAAVTPTEVSAAAAERCWQQWQWHTTIKRAKAERCSVQLGSDSSGSGCRICCGSSGSGRTLQRAAGQRQRRLWHTTFKRAEVERCSVQLGSGSGCHISCGSGSYGSRTQQLNLIQTQWHRLWHQRQWQNAAACGGAAAAAAAGVAAAAVAERCSVRRGSGSGSGGY